MITYTETDQEFIRRMMYQAMMYRKKNRYREAEACDRRRVKAQNVLNGKGHFNKHIIKSHG